MEKGNQNGGGEYDDLQNSLNMTSPKNPLCYIQINKYNKVLREVVKITVPEGSSKKLLVPRCWTRETTSRREAEGSSLRQ